MKYNLTTVMFFFLCCITQLKVHAQADVKTTEIWLVDIKNNDNKISFGVPNRITTNDFYDNQPCFSADGKFIYFASAPDTGQTDIMEYNISKKYTRRITNTPESEYQPQPMPSDKNLLSIVRVNAELAQGFYSVNMDGTEFKNLVENQDSLAYYTWMNDTTVGMYTLTGEFPTLEQFDMIPQQSVIVMEGGFGRCIQRIPGTDDLSFVAKKEKENWGIYHFFLAEDADTIFICNTLPGEEDFCWTPNGSILMASKGILYRYDTKQQEDIKWEVVADFTKTIGNFYRLAISPFGDKLAIVSYEGSKP